MNTKTISALSKTLLALTLGTCCLLPVNARPGSTPAAVQGRWAAGTTSATNYWNHDTGQFAGGSGSGQVYEFGANGRFAYYMLLEVRTGSLLTRSRTNCKGTVSFNGGTFTLHPTSGHYNAETGSRKINRDMTSADLTRMSKTYNWRMETGPDGKPHFVVFFNDGSKFNFERLSK